MCLGMTKQRRQFQYGCGFLLENTEEWEAFPWGNYSFQALKEAITTVMRKERVPDSGTVSYHLKGNTIAFSAWIFEAIPAFGEAIGGKNPKRQRPRFLRYNFVKQSKFPTHRQIVPEYTIKCLCL